MMQYIIRLVLFLALVVSVTSCFMFPPDYEEEDIPLFFEVNPDGEGLTLEIDFKRGKSIYFPLMAVWLEDTLGNYIQTVYVAESIAKGVFKHGDASTGMWMPGEIRRPAALPYWGHQRGVVADDGLYLPTKDNPLPDARTGATPSGSFVLTAKTDKVHEEPFMVLFEINQSWDWNSHWTNNKFPGDMEYMSSAQPAVVYSAMVRPEYPGRDFVLKPVGRSHHSGKTGELFDDLHTLTTALTIAKSIVVRVVSN